MMKKNKINTCVLLFALVFMVVNSYGQVVKNDKKPNIIFIMSDDHANRTISAYGSGLNQTPNIDRIANEGVIFINSYNSNSICGPSRASILTGKHSHKNGVTGNGAAWNGNQTLLPRVLQQNGYKTALIGKWHLNSNPGDEFDYWKILMGAGKQGFYYNPFFITSEGEELTEQGYSTDIVTNDALKWLDENAKENEQPFTLFVQYKATHVPRMPHFRYLDRYKNDTIPEPATLFDDYSTRERYAKEANMKVGYRPLPLLEDHDPSTNIYYKRMTKEQLKKWHSYKDPINKEYFELKKEGKLEGDALKKFAYQQFIKDYLRCVDGIDDNVGRILTWLDKNEQIKENTIIIYASDQSYFTGEHGFAEKRFMYEEGLKMPFVMRYPKKIKPGTRVKHMIQNIDYAPTLINAAGIDIPNDMQGKSFLKIAKGEQDNTWRKTVYYHYYDHGRHNVPRHDGIRSDRYKLIHFYTENKYEFYDLKSDPNEIDNLYSNDGYKNTIAEMTKELHQSRTTYEVPEKYFIPPYAEVKGFRKKNKK